MITPTRTLLAFVLLLCLASVAEAQQVTGYLHLGLG